ncbi:MAG: RNA polymerase III C11 subunit [Bogoriella megaspora]|nr:MAG: RNA polymerase III C11 subunit [Bogoriella megaspora]
MLLFCPYCSNILTIGKISLDDPDESKQGKRRFECRTCPYELLLEHRWFERRTMKRKEPEDVIGGAQSWENVDKTGILCPFEDCDGSEAYCMSIQIRSADEPSTWFYKVGSSNSPNSTQESCLLKDHSVRPVYGNGELVSGSDLLLIF